jgi:hypothetical protein
MSTVDKHRSFLFLADVGHEGNGFPAVCGRSPEGRYELNGIGIGPGEGRLLLDNGRYTEFEQPDEPGMHLVGRNTVTVWNGNPGDFLRFDAMTFPDLRDFTMVTWKDQNFGAFATDWELWNSPVLPQAWPRKNLIPLVDNCGLLVGYFERLVSVDNLFANPEGQIFYAGQLGSYMLGAESIRGRDLWVSDAGVTVQSADTVTKHRVEGGSHADVLLDIDGFVVAINFHKVWSPPGNPLFQAGKAIVGFMLPTKLPRISKECLPGGKREGTPECEDEMAEALLATLDWAFLVVDILTLGTSAIARKAALKILTFASRARKSIKGMKGAKEAEKLLARSAKALDNATSITLHAPGRKTSPGMAVSSAGVLPVEHLGRRTLIMGEDAAKFRGFMAQSQTESGLYDVVIHGDSTSFAILVKTKPNGKQIWKDVSVREVADAIRTKLAPGDKIRLLACDVGNTGGPAQQLANELNRTVWASSTSLPAVPKAPKGVARRSFVPDEGGRFYEFVPQRGDATLSGKGGKVTGDELQGEIRPGGGK